MYQKGEIINAQGKKRGFALIELMIVIVIIAILGIIAIPAYQDYTIRAQISEGLTLASGAKPVVAEYYANHGVYPQGNSDVSYTGATGSYISSINIAKNGVILATLGNQANQLVQGKVIALTPSTISDETIDFEIQTPKLSFLDKLFGVRSAIAQASPDGWQCYSNVPKQYLATSCMSKTITVNGKDSNGNEVPIITTENQTVSCPTGQVGSIEQQRTVSTFRDGTPTAYGDWQTVTNSCAVPPPTVTTENQTVSCPTGQMGAIAQQRTVTTPYQGTPTYSAWTTTSNTCFVPPPTVTTESQTISCQAGYSGSITQQRTVTTPYQGTPTYSAWTTTNTSCVPLQQPAYTKTDLFTVGNVIYKNGYVYWGYLNTTTNPPTVVGTLLNKTSMDMDGTQHYQYGSYQITLSGNGVLNYGGLYGYSNVIGGGTYGQATPSYTSSGTTVSQTVYRLYASSSWPQYTNFYNAASNALTYPSASSFASYQTELQNFKNSIATVKAQNGGGYPANYPQILIDIANKVGA